MKFIFALMCIFSLCANADDSIGVKLLRKNDQAVSNFRFKFSDDLKIDSNTTINEKSLFRGKYDSDVGVIYKFTHEDSVRISLRYDNNSCNISLRHKF